VSNPFEPLDGVVADSIDLHGMTGAEAVAAATAFVRRVQKRAPGSLVHIITGRGRGSPGRPVLKPKIRTLLRAGELPVRAWGEDLDNGGFLVRLR
jgi:DNA-nicking Smr family endonuclease